MMTHGFYECFIFQIKWGIDTVNHSIITYDLINFTQMLRNVFIIKRKVLILGTIYKIIDI